MMCFLSYGYLQIEAGVHAIMDDFPALPDTLASHANHRSNRLSRREISILKFVRNIQTHLEITFR